MTIIASPAYGRDYRTAAEVFKAWLEDKDFVHESRLFTGGGMYLNRSDLESLHTRPLLAKLFGGPEVRVELRFNRQYDCVTVELDLRDPQLLWVISGMNEEEK